MRGITAAGGALCPKCGRFHTEACYLDIPVCYRCRVRGHIQRDCHAPRQGTGRGFAQPSSSSAATPSVRPPALAGRGSIRGEARGRSGPSRFYALSGRQSVEASPDDGASGVKGVKGAAEGFIRKGVHTAKCVAVRCSDSFCQ
uniref:Uncharacterized protein LOC104243589 n=1 Tax=Nicotiana sylvestris TaxID=4096 RepID=A0A1U7XYR0_NICSY|nr:PREDICTED: uncharacterized protein LOC104243589 [Nicotiana sylvestris]